MVGVFAFIDYWSQFLWPSSRSTIDAGDDPAGLQMPSRERGTDWGPLMAAVTMTTILSILLVVFAEAVEKGRHPGCLRTVTNIQTMNDSERWSSLVVRPRS